MLYAFQLLQKGIVSSCINVYTGYLHNNVNTKKEMQRGAINAYISIHFKYKKMLSIQKQSILIKKKNKKKLRFVFECQIFRAFAGFFFF